MFTYPTKKRSAPNDTCLLIMKQLHGYFRATSKKWAHISQAWLMEQLEKYEHQRVPSSTLNYNLRILEDNGFIQRQKRHIRDNATGQIIFRPSLYKITKKLRSFFSNFAAHYKRCGWTPTLRQLGQGFTAAVGMVTNRKEAFDEYRRQIRARGSG